MSCEVSGDHKHPPVYTTSMDHLNFHKMKAQSLALVLNLNSSKNLMMNKPITLRWTRCNYSEVKQDLKFGFKTSWSSHVIRSIIYHHLHPPKSAGILCTTPTTKVRSSNIENKPVSANESIIAFRTFCTIFIAYTIIIVFQ